MSMRGTDCRLRCGLVASLLTLISQNCSEALVVSSSTPSRISEFRVSSVAASTVLRSTASDMTSSSSPEGTPPKRKKKIPVRTRKLTLISENSTQVLLESDATWAKGYEELRMKNNINRARKKTRRNGSRERLPSPMEVSKLFQKQMTDHEILTKEEELELGRQVQVATRLRELLSELVEGRLQEIEKVQQRREMWADPPTDEAQLLAMAFPRFWEEQDKLRLKQPMHDEEFQMLELGVPSIFTDSHGFSIVDQYDDPASLTLDDLDPEDKEHFQRRSFSQLSQPSMDDSVLNEIEIKAAFDGLGRKELRSKLLEGAMAKEKLIRCNLRLVVSIASDWARKTLKTGQVATLSQLYTGNMYRPSLDDAIHEGVLGLARAAEKYDPGRNLKFSTYSHYWITSYVRKCFQERKLGVNKAPRRYYTLKNKYQKFLRDCYQKGNEIPPRDEIAQILGVTEARLNTVLSVMHPVVSLNDPVSTSRNGDFSSYGEEGIVEVGDCIISQEDSPNEYVELCFLRQTLENALATELTPHERDIIRLRLGLDDGKSRTAKQVAALCGGTMTVREVRRVERQAYRKLRSEQLMAFLDVDHLKMEKAKRRLY